MEITVNKQPKKIEDSSLISLIASTLGEKTKGIAVAVNNSIIPKTDWETTQLKDKDNVLIIKATQGG